ncbi:hypothetical protein EDC96DRAFT_430650, partial [Choanephora cucurbitarum]
ILPGHTRKIPLSVRLFLIEPAFAESPNAEDSYDTKEAERISHTEHLESLDKNSFNVPLYIIGKIENALKRSVANISNICESSASFPQIQRSPFF